MKRFTLVLCMLLIATFAFAAGAKEQQVSGFDGTIPPKPDQISLISTPNISGLWDYVREWEKITGIKVNISEMDLPSLQTKATTYFATGSSEIDILYSYVAPTAEWANAGHLENIKSYLTDEEWAEFSPGALNCVTYKGDIYGLPYFYSIRLFYCNMDILRANGFTKPPTNWDEFYRIAVACTDPSKDQYGYLAGLGDNESAMISLQDFNAMYGQTLVSKDDQILFSNTNGIAALEKLVSLQRSGALDPAGYGVTTGDSRRARFLTGKVAMAHEWAPLMVMIEAQDTFKAQIAIAPKVLEHGALTGSEGLVISKYSKNKYWSVDLLKYLTSKDVQTRYTKRSNWFPVREDVFNDPQVLAVSSSMVAAKAQAEHPTFRWAAPYYSEARAVIADNVFKALSGVLSPEEAVKISESKVLDIIKQYQ